MITFKPGLAYYACPSMKEQKKRLVVCTSSTAKEVHLAIVNDTYAIAPEEFDGRQYAKIKADDGCIYTVSAAIVVDLQRFEEVRDALRA